MTDDELLLGEIACRPEGAGVVDGATLSTGVDLWEELMLLSQGRPVTCGAEGSDPAMWMATSLPTEPGRVVALSTAEDFANSDGVRLEDVDAEVGDAISSHMHSSSTTGIVFLAVADTSAATINDRIWQIRSAHHLQIERTPDQKASEAIA